MNYIITFVTDIYQMTIENISSGLLAMKNYFLFLIIAIILSSCTRKSRVLNMLSRIEYQIMEDPKLAQYHLDSLGRAESDILSSGELQARFILLDTYCKFRCLEESSNDSLIDIADRYFSHGGSAHDQLLSKFLHGIILCNVGKYDEALLKFKEAEAVGQPCSDHFLLGQLFGQMSLLCNHLNDADFPVYAQKSLDEYEEKGDSLYILDSKVNRAIALLECQQEDESLAQLKDYLPVAEQMKDSFIIAKIYHYMGAVETKTGQFDSAFVHLKKSLDCKVPIFRVNTYSFLSVCYGYFQQRDSALYCHQLVQTEDSSADKNSVCQMNAAYMYKYLGENDAAFDCYTKFHQIVDESQSKRLANSFSKGEHDYAEECFSRLKRKYKTMSLCSLYLALALFICVSIIAFKWKCRKEDEAEPDEKMKSTLQGMKQSTIVLRLRQLALDEKPACEADWVELDRVFEELLPSFRRKLFDQYELNDLEWHICQLQKLDFSNKEISTLICRAKNTISSVNVRLFKRKFGKMGRSAEWHEYIRHL